MYQDGCAVRVIKISIKYPACLALTESGMQDVLVSLHSESIQFGGATVSKQERRPLFHRKKCDGVDKHTPFYSIAQTGTANLIAPVF